MMSSSAPSKAAEADDSDLTTMDDEVPISHHVHDIMTGLVSVNVGMSEKLQQSLILKKFLSRPDGYIELQPPCEAQLPPLEWNRHFRKSYSILAWIRPHVEETTTPSTTHSQHKQVLYRFSTSEKDYKGAGICVQLGDWQMSENDDSLIHTTVTCFLLPTQSQQTAMTHASLLQIPLSLQKNKWQLLGISHVYPYLKPSMLVLTVNGTVVSQGELAYPVVDNHVVMEYASLFTNIGSGGVHVLSKSDDKTPASQLHTLSFSNCVLKWQVATIALYPDAICPEFQAILANAGVALSLQQEGRILCPLPPIANATKGSTLDSHGGPSVGIPLCTHSLALELQHEISRVVLYVSATNAQVLKTRIVCPFLLYGGHYESTPKVGLMQPSVPLMVEAAIHFVHGAKVMHTLSDYLLESPCLLHLVVEESSPSLSVLWSEQSLVSTLVLPFFLALPPSISDLQVSLYELSLQQLYQLYTKNGIWAVALLDLLVTAIQHQGGRCHEEVLQSGILPILSSTLRRSLVRAQQLRLWDYDTFDEFRSSIMDITCEAPIHSATSPKRIPLEIAQACAELVAVSCGNDDTTIIGRESDLAMSSVFGLGLDLDLWGVCVPSATLVIRAVAERYGGLSIERGCILRRQIPIQSLLDQIRIRLEGLTLELETVANSLASIVTSMLLSSLSNKRNIVEAEHDVSACIGALSDCPLGTVGAHVILTALSFILEWCDVIPTQSSNNDDDNGRSDDDKLQVATRLGRNLLMGQYHDVVAPMLLSRTVFCGERVLAQSDAPHLWQYHWRLSLLLFVVCCTVVCVCVCLCGSDAHTLFVCTCHFCVQWVSSISGPEGDVAAKSTGSLLFASGLAGSLNGCMVVDKDRDSHLLASLLLPPPALALTVSSNRGHEYVNVGDCMFVCVCCMKFSECVAHNLIVTI